MKRLVKLFIALMFAGSLIAAVAPSALGATGQSGAASPTPTIDWKAFIQQNNHCTPSAGGLVKTIRPDGTTVTSVEGVCKPGSGTVQPFDSLPGVCGNIGAISWGVSGNMCMGWFTSSGTRYAATQFTDDTRYGNFGCTCHTEISLPSPGCNNGALLANSNTFSLNPGDTLYFSTPAVNYTVKYSGTEWYYPSGGPYVNMGSVCNTF